MKKARFGTWANKCEYFARENSGFRIYNLARVVLREWLQATKKCFKLGHSGTRGIPGHQHRSNIRRQGTGKSRQAGGCAIIRTFAIQSIKVMASKRDGGFECGEKKKRQQKPPSYPGYVSWTDQTYGPDGFYLISISNGMELVWKLWDDAFRSQKRCHNMP